MSYVVPIHRPSSVRHALRIRLVAGEDQLVIARANRLEVWHVSADSMTMMHSSLIYGNISMLQRLRPRDSDTDLLWVGTERFEYFTLAWNPAKQALETEEAAYQDPAERHMRESQSQNKCLVDPSGRFMTLHVWQGVMNVMRLGSHKRKVKKTDFMEQVRLTELVMKASTFVPTETGHPTVAFLYQTRPDVEDAELAIYRLTTDDKNTTCSKFDPQKDRLYTLRVPDPFARILIPVDIVENETKRYHHRHMENAKAQLGGVIIVGETMVVYVDTLTHVNVSAALKDPRIFVAWAKYDVTHYLLADDYGRLHLLTLETEGVVVTGLKFISLDVITSRASCLVFMDNDVLFLGSHHGDSQLLRLRVDAASPKPIVELVQALPNIAPIIDFAIMDMGNRDGDDELGNEFASGQARIVAGCGVNRSGSLRSIRSGVGLEDIGTIDEMENVRGLFTLKSHGSQKDDTLVVSFLTDTRIFKFDAEGGVEELPSYHGIRLDQPTLLVRNLAWGKLLQITPSMVTLFDLESGVVVDTWNTPGDSTITSASANDKWALLSLEGKKLVCLNFQKNMAMKEQVVKDDDQIACVHASGQSEDVGVVGFWTAGTISIIDLNTLNAVSFYQLRKDEESLSTPRDIALVQLHSADISGPTLLVAMEDGNVVTLNVSKEDYSLSGRKNVILGRRQARMHILPREDGGCNVFATTEHSSLIYSDHGRIVYSAVTAEDAVYVAPLDAEAYPGAIVIATEQHIKISKIDSERRTAVQPLPTGETVRRLAYSPGLKAFGLGCVKKEIINNEEVVVSSFKLVDEVIFDLLGQPYMLNSTSSVEMVEAVIRAELTSSTGQPVERFIVGTSFYPDDEVTDHDNINGRILVFGLDSDRNPYIVAQHKLKGPCRCLAMMGDKIVAGLLKTVIVYSYSEDSSTSGRLKKLASWRPATHPVSIAVWENVIGVADLMQSLSLVEYVPPKDGKSAQLVEGARHFGYAWATALCHLDGETWLQSDAEGNLMVLRRNIEAPTPHDRKQIEVTGDFNLGEQVNQIRRLQISPSANAVAVPKAFLGTVEGSLYVLCEISQQYLALLLDFQIRLQKAVQSECLGELKAMEWRAFRSAQRTSEGPFRFVDGELIERFLDMDDVRQEELCEGLGPTVEAMRSLVEELKRLH